MSGTIRYVPSQYERFYVDLDRSTEEYLKTFSSKSRSTLKRKTRRFAEFSGGDIHWREYRRVHEMEEFYANARRVSAITYQEKLLNAGLPDSASFRKKMLELAERDQVRGYLLYHKEKPVAYLYTPITDEIARCDYLGFDPEYARWSPGVILQWLVLERLLDEQGVRTFDFLEGETASKRFFATGSQRCADIHFFKPSLKNILLVISHSMLDSLSAFLGVVLDRLRLKSRVKELIRGK